MFDVREQQWMQGIWKLLSHVFLANLLPFFLTLPTRLSLLSASTQMCFWLLQLLWRIWTSITWTHVWRLHCLCSRQVRDRCSVRHDFLKPIKYSCQWMYKLSDRQNQSSSINDSQECASMHFLSQTCRPIFFYFPGITFQHSLDDNSNRRCIRGWLHLWTRLEWLTTSASYFTGFNVVSCGK